MALFSIGVIEHTYVPPDMFYEEMIQHWNGPAGMGWGITHWGSPDLTVFHGGSNGRPQAYLMIKPKKRLSVSILATAKSGAYFDLTQVSRYAFNSIILGCLTKAVVSSSTVSGLSGIVALNEKSGTMPSFYGGVRME